MRDRHTSRNFVEDAQREDDLKLAIYRATRLSPPKPPRRYRPWLWPAVMFIIAVLLSVLVSFFYPAGLARF